jgi:hypothetical protein
MTQSLPLFLNSLDTYGEGVETISTEIGRVRVTFPNSMSCSAGGVR